MFFLFCMLASIPLESPNNNEMVIEVSSKKNLDQIREELKHLSSKGQSKALIAIDLNDEGSNGYICFQENMKAHGQPLGHPRPYFIDLTENEKKDIQFILTFLANHSIFTLAAHKGELEAAGDRIDHIHPLKFFTHVFTSDELIVAIRNIRTKGWVWRDFSGGIKQSLATESNAQNMHQDVVLDFAKKIKIDPKLILTSVQEKKWENFMDTLIKNVPRSGEADRYKD